MNPFDIAKQLESEGLFARASTGDIRAASLFTRLVAYRANLTGQPNSWGWLTKSAGEKNVDGFSIDAMVSNADQSDLNNVWDLISGADAPGAHLSWNGPLPRRPHNRWMHPIPLTNEEMAYLKPTTPTAHSTKLGASLFWLLGGVDHMDVLKPNLEWLGSMLKADFVRAFMVLGGDLFSGVDPWLNWKTDWRASDFRSRIREAHNVAALFNLKIAWTLVGGRAQVSTIDDQLRFIDTVGPVLAEDADRVEYVEVWNEYNVNNGQRLEIRNMAKVLEPYIPDTPIALSYLSSTHAHATAADVAREIREFYDGSVANLITIHPTRPEPVWRAESVRPLVGDLYALADSEPRGPGASAGGDVDNPALLAADYQSSIRAGAYGYVFHSLPGVWGGRCHGFPNKNVVAAIPDVRNAREIAAALSALRHNGRLPTVPGGSVNPYPDESTYWTTFKDEVVARYARANAALDDMYPVWFARTAYDIAVGLSPDESKAKHLAELDEALGLA